MNERAVFLREGDAFAATALAGGPWSPDAQHGGAVCGLLGRALEAVSTPVPMRIVRATFELMRPVPLRALHVQTATLRSGKRTQLAQASLFDGEVEVARATGLWLRTAGGLGLEGGPNLAVDEPLALPPGRGAPPTIRVEHLPGYLRAIEFVRADGEPTGSGVSTVWIRNRAPFVEGESMTPFQRLAAASDFTSGVANALDFARYVSINPDITLYVEREPVSEWIAIRGTTSVRPDGTGMSRSELFDERGRVATASASLFVDAR